MRNRPIALWLVALIGCWSGDESSTGVTDADAAPRLRLVEDFRIGNRDDPEIGFSRIDEIDVDRDGSIYVFETQPPEIRVYSGDGDFLRTIGGPGEGPGEFRGPRFSSGVHGDTVWVIDPFGNRITLFSREGELLSTSTMPGVPVALGRPGATASLIPFEMGADGLFASEVGPLRLPVEIVDGVARPVSMEGEPFDPIPVPRVRFDAAGNVVDTMGWGTDPTYRDPQRVTWLHLADGEIEVRIPDAAGEGDGNFRVVRIDARGDTVRSRSFRYRPIEGDSTDGFVDPTVGFGRVGSDGRIWLQRGGRESDTAVRWLILDPDLEPVGELEVPRTGFRVEWSLGDSLLAVVADDVGVPWVVRYHLEPR